MSVVSFFDCNCMVGRRSAPRQENNLSVEGLIEELDRAGIDGALAVHAAAKEYDPLIGNAALSDLCSKHDRFVPCYVVLPEHTGEMPSGDDLLRYFEAGGARAARLYPREHSFGLEETWSGGLLGCLEEARVPVLIDLDQTSWQEIGGVLSHHPSLILLVTRTGYRIDRWVYPLLARYPGLRLETANYELHRSIEAVTERFGPERLVFGTGLPIWDAGGAIGHVMYAGIDDCAKARIAGLNLRSLLWTRRRGQGGVE